MTATLKPISLAAATVPSSVTSNATTTTTTMMVSVSAVVPQSSNVYNSPSVSFHNILPTSSSLSTTKLIQEDASSQSSCPNNSLVLQASSSFLSNFSSLSSSSAVALPRKSSTMNSSLLTAQTPTSTQSELTVSKQVDDSLSEPLITCSKEAAQADLVMEKVVDDDEPVLVETVLNGSRSNSQEGVLVLDEDERERIKEEKENVPTSTKEIFNQDENSNSTQGSSSDTNGSTKRKRRRGEDQLLMDHLHGLDRSLANNIANDIKNETTVSSNDNNNIKDSCDMVNQNANSCDSTPKKSRVDSPAFHLRPRRSHRTSGGGQHGYCSSGSSSPITYLSPVKNPPKTPIKSPCHFGQPTNYTARLLNDTSRQLSKYVTDDSGTVQSHNPSYLDNVNHSGQNGGIGKYHLKHSSVVLKDMKPDIVNSDNFKLPKRMYVRSLDRSILCDVDVSVFAELVSPLKLASHNRYSNNYISLKIDHVKPLRFAQLTTTGQSKVSCPYLELVTSDINDRFSLQHTKGIFDDLSLTASPLKNLTVFLVGTYALKGNKLASKGSIINIVKFRTTKKLNEAANVNEEEDNEKSKGEVRKVSENVKKRKLLESVKQEEQPDEQPHYNFQIIVDSVKDSCFSGMLDKEIKEEECPDNLENGEVANELLNFEQIFNHSQLTVTDNSTSSASSCWVPLVSFSTKWRAPDDPKKLNETLYIEQPSIPKFESTSRTVKLI